MRKLLQLVVVLPIVGLLYWVIQQAYAAYHKKAESPVILFASFESGVNGSWLQLRADHTFDYTTALLWGDNEVTSGRYQQTDSVVLLDRLPTRSLLTSHKLVIRYTAQHIPYSIWQLNPKGQVDSSLAVLTIYPVQPPQ